MALFANSLRCNGASAAEGRPSVARLAWSRQPVTRKRHADTIGRIMAERMQVSLDQPVDRLWTAPLATFDGLDCLIDRVLQELQAVTHNHLGVPIADHKRQTTPQVSRESVSSTDMKIE